MEIRAADVGDLPGALALHDQFAPYQVVTEVGLRHRLTSPSPPGQSAFAAVDGDQVVGWVTTGLIAGSDPLGGQLRLLVRPGYRGQGLGTRLVEAAHDVLRSAGATTARVFAEPSASEWAERWGYRQTRQVHYAGIDPQKAPEIGEVPSGIELIPLNQADPRKLYEADVIAQRTKPGDATIVARPYDDWLRAIWNSPVMVLDLSVAALYDGEIAAFTLGNGDRTKVWSQMTATMPDYRGRGLAKLVKAAALQRAAAAGVQHCYTANYDGNTAMLAVNEWLGYYRIATHSVLVCPL